MRKHFLLLFLMAVLPLAGWAAPTITPGANTVLRFNAIVDNTDPENPVYTAEIKGFVNGGDVANLVIPATVQFAEIEGGDVHTYKVVKVLADAFKDNETLKSVTFSANLTEIEKAFTGCKNLTTVNFTAAVDLNAIAEKAFEGTAITALDLSTTKVVTINNLLGTKYSATPAEVVNNNTLTTVKLPKTVTSIEEKAFENCTALATVEFAAEDNAENQTIGVGAFKGTAIQTLDLSNTTIETIGNLFGTQYAATAFANTVLTTVKLPKTVTSIEEKAFENCTALATVEFAATGNAEHQTIGVGAFKGTAIQTLDLSKTTIETIVNMFGTQSAATAVANTALTTVKLPKTVTSIGGLAFDNCTALTTVTFETATDAATIGDGAFKGTAIQHLDLSKTKVAVINNLFGTLFGGDPTKTTDDVANNTLTTVTLPVTWTTIVEKAFENCAALATINLYPGTGTSADGQTIATLAFNGTALTALDFTKTKVSGVPANLLMDGTNVKKNETLETVTLTDQFAASADGLNSSFANCEALTTVNGLENTHIVALKANEFKGDKVLATINTSKITTFGASAFQGCAKLTSIDLSAATTLGVSAFQDAGLTSVSIPKAVAVIPTKCFYNCEDLATVTFAHGASDAFTSIGEYAFAYAKIESIIIPAKMALTDADAIAQYAFGSCEALKTVTFKPAVDLDTDMDIFNNKAFLGCSDVKINTTEGVRTHATCPLNCTYVNEIAPVTTTLDAIAYKNGQNKYFVKYVDTTKDIRIHKSEAKVYDAWLDEGDHTLNLIQFKTRNGYSYIAKGQVALIVSNKETVPYELSDQAANYNTSWVRFTAADDHDQVLKITNEDTERLALLGEAPVGYSIFAWMNSEAKKVTGFQKLASGKTVPKGSLYVFAMEEENAAGARGLTVVWRDEEGNVVDEGFTTSIDDIMDAPVMNNGEIYNIQGVRVNDASQKGIYIQNGKKFVVK